MDLFITSCLILTVLTCVSCKPDFDDYTDYLYPYNYYPSDIKNAKQNTRRSANRGKHSIYANKVRWRVTSIANRVFAFKLYTEVASAHPRQNILISPIVVSTGLSMTLLGANGITEKEIMSVLEYANIGNKRNRKLYTKSDVPRLYESMLQKLNSTSDHVGDTFLIACRLFGERSERFLPEFVQDTAKYYNAEIELVDFASHPEDARNQINTWVGETTQGSIPEALPSGSISSDTLLALASAAYFKGTWQNKFDPSSTRPGSFEMSDGSTATVDFMNGELTILNRYSYSIRSHIAILPYKTHRSEFSVEMQLFLPDDEEALNKVEKMSEMDLRRETRNMRNTTVEISLPKFRLEFGVDLSRSLTELGLESLFQNADLSGMNGNRNLRFSNAMHKGFIEVDEKGTTASASFVSSITRHARPRPLIFDHPFFFLIREKSSNSILFMGRVESPV